MRSSNQNIPINMFMPIGGGRVLIFVVYLGLLLLAGVFCTTFEGGSLHLHFKLLL